MKAEQIREKSNEELVKMQDDLHEELFNLRFQLVSRQLDNPLRIRSVRRDLARVKTVMKERQLGNLKRDAKKAEEE